MHRVPVVFLVWVPQVDVILLDLFLEVKFRIFVSADTCFPGFSSLPVLALLSFLLSFSLLRHTCPFELEALFPA